jgi:hypothetical protein
VARPLSLSLDQPTHQFARARDRMHALPIRPSRVYYRREQEPDKEHVHAVSPKAAPPPAVRPASPAKKAPVLTAHRLASDTLQVKRPPGVRVATRLPEGWAAWAAANPGAHCRGVALSTGTGDSSIAMSSKTLGRWHCMALAP